MSSMPPPPASSSLAPRAPVATLEWPQLARLLAAAAVIGAIIGSVG
jgi:hypothetical protein